MITVERYQAITGDTSTDDEIVQQAIDDATAELEEYLDRPLVEAERTETLRPDRRGRLWPRATPLVSAEGYEIDGLALTGAAPFGSIGSPFDPATGVEVTYTGGWATADDLPICIQRDLAMVAYRFAHPAAGMAALSEVPAGASSVRLGDAAVTFGPGGAGAAGAGSSAFWSRQTKGYRYVRVDTPVGA